MKSRSKHAQDGYVLLTLMLFVALLAIASMAWIEKVDFQIKRDREEELIHRGVQYSRAIRRYVKKFGHYPARIEDLESSNNIRFLRKRYKDPVTGKDFKLLRMNDVQMAFSPGAASELPPGSPGAGPASPAAAANSNPNAASGANATSQSGTPANGQPATANGQGGTAAGATNETPDADQSAADATGSSDSKAVSAVTQENPSGPGNGPTFGGLPIVGVASTSKEKTIREFNKKNHYSQWQFIYDPSTDRGGLLMTPNQPPLMVGAQTLQQQNGQPINGQNPGTGFGQGGMSSPGMNPQPPPTTPQQQ